MTPIITIQKVFELLRASTLSLEREQAFTHLICSVIADEEKKEQVAALSLTTLPLHVCEAAGGEAAAAIRPAAAWRALQIAARFLDDVEDGDEIVLNSQIIPPQVAVNIGTAFIAIANVVLMEDDCTPTSLLAYLGTEFNRTILQMAAGQHDDIARGYAMDLEAYRQIMAAKSGQFFLLGSWAGARCATDDEEILSCFESFGYNLGMMLQLNDDLKDFRRTGHGGDMAAGRPTFPSIYALSVASDVEKERLLQLLAKARSEAEAEKDAKALIRTLGGEVYLLAETMRYRRRAAADLNESGAPREKLAVLERYLSKLSLLSAVSGNVVG